MNNLNPVLVIDFNVLAYQNWHKMRSPNYEAKTGIEIQEYSRNLALNLYYLHKRYSPTKSVFCLDAHPNWRNEIYNEFYRYNVDFYKSLEETDTWVINFDHKYYTVHLDPYTEKWNYKKMVKSEIQPFLADHKDSAKYTYFRAGKVPQYILDNYPDAPQTVQEHPDWPALEHIIPKYKGQRSDSKWPYETPKEEWRKLTKKAAYNMADIFGAVVAEVPDAEGDDLAAVYIGNLAQELPEQPVILVTVDRDLEQLRIFNPNLSIFNPTNMKYFSDRTMEALKYKLICKILGGDGSDNIPGVSLIKTKNSRPEYTADGGFITARGPFAEVTWDNKVSELRVKSGKSTADWVYKKVETIRKKLPEGDDPYNKLFEYLVQNTHPLEWGRNLMLISLNFIPEFIHEQASNRCNMETDPAGTRDHPELGRPLTLLDCGLDQREIKTEEVTALKDREKDKENGYKNPPEVE